MSKKLLPDIYSLPGVVSEKHYNFFDLSKTKYIKLNYNIEFNIDKTDGYKYIGFIPLKNKNNILIKKYINPNFSKNEKITIIKFLPTSKWHERVQGRFEAAYKLLRRLELWQERRSINGRNKEKDFSSSNTKEISETKKKLKREPLLSR